MSQPDQIQRFLFDNTDVRGVLTGLRGSYQQVVTRQPYPPVLRRLLGEMLAAATLLSSTLKFDGRLSLLARSEGRVSMLMAECTQNQNLRGVARWEGELGDDETLLTLLEKGQLVITLEPTNGKRYQGIVPLSHPQLSQCLEDYFLQSEQLATRILLAADGARAAGLLLQAMPSSAADERFAENWSRISHLGSTLTPQELLELDNDVLLYRLFHEEQVRTFKEESLRFFCDCSRERSLAALRTLGSKELAALLEEQGAIEMDCQFCNEHYRYGQDDFDALFNGDSDASSPH